MAYSINPSAYRYPHEHLILTLTVALVLTVIAVTAAATLCTSVLVISLVVGLAYASSRSMHQALLQQARPVNPTQMPAMARIAQESIDRLQAGNVEVFVAPSNQLNAYTFGLSDPKIVVLYGALFKVMDDTELRFILGHELGHIRLGHTWLNSIVGGMAGIPSSSFASAVLTMAFLSWNRACEYSADRAGLLACGDPGKAVTALIKLVAGPQGRTQAGLELAYQQIDSEDDTWLGNLSEMFATHPMLIRRITEIRRFAASPAYRQLKAQILEESR
jgi:Zn-dependent protease with chaperone function